MSDLPNENVMRSDNNPSVGSSDFEALRAVDLYPLGMRRWAHPNSMPMLAGLGYVVEGQAEWEGARRCEMGWFITPAGRELLNALGTVEHGLT